MTKAEEKRLREEMEHLTISGRDLLERGSAEAARADRAEAEVHRLRREISSLQSKYDRTKNDEATHAITKTEARMLRSELDRVWAFLRKERGCPVPEPYDGCPF